MAGYIAFGLIIFLFGILVGTVVTYNIIHGEDE